MGLLDGFLEDYSGKTELTTEEFWELYQKVYRTTPSYIDCDRCQAKVYVKKFNREQGTDYKIK